MTLNVGAAPSCVTETLYEVPPAVKVIASVRLLVEVFASAVTVNVASPEPESLESVSQVALVDAVQDWLEVIVNDILPPDEVKEAEVGVTLNVCAAPSCEMLTV